VYVCLLACIGLFEIVRNMGKLALFFIFVLVFFRFGFIVFSGLFMGL